MPSISDTEFPFGVSEDQKYKASNILVSALDDYTLRVVRLMIGKPDKTIYKLDTSYDFNYTARKI